MNFTKLCIDKILTHAVTKTLTIKAIKGRYMICYALLLQEAYGWHLFTPRCMSWKKYYPTSLTVDNIIDLCIAMSNLIENIFLHLACV